MGIRRNKVEQGEQGGTRRTRRNKGEQGEQGGTGGNKGEQGEQKSLDFEVILRQSCLFSQNPLAGFLKTLGPNGPHFFRATVFFSKVAIIKSQYGSCHYKN